MEEHLGKLVDFFILLFLSAGLLAKRLQELGVLPQAKTATAVVQTQSLPKDRRPILVGDCEQLREHCAEMRELQQRHDQEIVKELKRLIKDHKEVLEAQRERLRDGDQRFDRFEEAFTNMGSEIAVYLQAIQWYIEKTEDSSGTNKRPDISGQINKLRDKRAQKRWPWKI